jgi:hypothetical protein
MPQATLEEDIVFGEIAVKNQILSVQQVSECLRAYQKLEDKTFLGLPQICIQRGYLSAAQAQSLVRARNFLVKHREDVKIAELLHGQRVVRSHQIRYAFRLQEQAYYSGALVIPRLIDILDDEGILARDIAEDALAAGLRAENMTENDLVVSVDDLPDLAIPEEVERELHVNGIEAVQKIAQDESGFLEQLQRLEHTLPAEKGRFRVDDYIKQLPKAETSPLASSVIRHDLLRKTGEVKAVRRKVREVTKVPRAFYRFNVRDSYVEYATSSWIPILPSMKSSHSPIIDVSLGGIQLATPYEFDVGEKLNLDIHIPFLRRSLRSKGEVRWFEESDESGPHYRVGVEFTKLSKDGIECLKRLAKSPALRGEKRRKK